VSESSLIQVNSERIVMKIVDTYLILLLHNFIVGHLNYVMHSSVMLTVLTECEN